MVKPDRRWVCCGFSFVGAACPSCGRSVDQVQPDPAADPAAGGQLGAGLIDGAAQLLAAAALAEVGAWSPVAVAAVQLAALEAVRAAAQRASTVGACGVSVAGGSD